MISKLKSLLFLLLAIGINPKLLASWNADDGNIKVKFEVAYPETNDVAHVTYSTTGGAGDAQGTKDVDTTSNDTGNQQEAGGPHNPTLDDRGGSSNTNQEPWTPERWTEDYSGSNTMPTYNYGDDSNGNGSGVKGNGSGAGSGGGLGSGNSGALGSGSGAGSSGSGGACQGDQKTNFWDSPFSRFQTQEGIEHIQHLIDTDSPELRNSRAQNALVILENSGKITIPRKATSPQTYTMPTAPIEVQAPAPQSSFVEDTGSIIKAAYVGTHVASAIGDLFPSVKKAWRDYAGHDARSPEYQKEIRDSIEANTIHVMTDEERRAWGMPSQAESDRQARDWDQLLRSNQQRRLEQQRREDFEAKRKKDIENDIFQKQIQANIQKSIEAYLRARDLRADVASRRQNYEAVYINPKQRIESRVNGYMEEVSSSSYSRLNATIELCQNESNKYRSLYKELTGTPQLNSIDTLTEQRKRSVIATVEACPLNVQGYTYYRVHRQIELEIGYAITEQCIAKLKALKAVSEINIKKKIDQFNLALEKNSFEACAKKLKDLNVAIAALEKEKVCYADAALVLQKKLADINDKIALFNGNYAQQGWANVKGYWWTSESYESLSVDQNKLQKDFAISSAKREEIVDKLIVANGQKDCICKKHPSLNNTFHENLAQARNAYYKLLKMNYFSTEDQKLLTVMNKAIADQDNERRPFSELTSDAKGLLRRCNISPDTFDKMVGNTFQEHLYDTTTSILLDQAQSLKLHQGNQEIVEYINATTNMSAAALDMIRNGKAIEAIATVKMAQQFSKATEIAIGVIKGGAKGIGVRAVACVAARFLPPQVQLPLLILSGADMVYRTVTMEERYKKFMALAPGQQAEEISQFVAAYGVGFLSSCSYFHRAWNGASKIIRNSQVMFGGHLPSSQSTLRLSGAVASVKRKPIDVSVARQITPEMVAAKYAQEAVKQPLFTTRVLSIPVASGAPVHLDPLKVYQSLPSTVLIAQAAAKDAVIREKFTPKVPVKDFIHPQVLLTEMQNLVPAFRRAHQTVEQFIAPNILTPQTKRQVEAYMQKYNAKVDKIEKGLSTCPEHNIRYYSGSKHFYIPRKIQGIITNNKDWEKLAKVFDGTMQTPAGSGNPAQIWTDYQHLLGPVIKMDCTNAEIELAGFHHDYLGKIRESGVLKCTDIVEKPHGFYELRWAYGNSEAKPSSFFPDDWTPAKVMTKIEEALRNPIEGLDPFFEKGEWIVYGRIAEGIEIRIVLEASKANKFVPTGKIKSAYPDFEYGAKTKKQNE